MPALSVFLVITIICIEASNGLVGGFWNKRLSLTQKPMNKFEETRKKLDACYDSHEIPYYESCSQEKFEAEYKAYAAKGNGSGWEDLKSVLVVSCNAPSSCIADKCRCERSCPVKHKATPTDCKTLMDDYLHQELVMELEPYDRCLDSFRGREGDKCAGPEDYQDQIDPIFKKYGIPDGTLGAELPLVVQIEVSELECTILGNNGCIMGKCRALCPKCTHKSTPKDPTITCKKEEEDFWKAQGKSVPPTPKEWENGLNKWNGKHVNKFEETRKKLDACYDTHEIPYYETCSQDKFEAEYKAYAAKGNGSGWEDLKSVLVVSCNVPSSCIADKCRCDGNCPVKPKTTPTDCKTLMDDYLHQELVMDLDPYYVCLDSFRGREGDTCADPDLYHDQFSLIDPILKKYSIADGTLGSELPLVVQIALAQLECTVLGNTECIMGKCRALCPKCTHQSTPRDTKITCKKEEEDFWKAQGKPVPPTPNKQ